MLGNTGKWAKLTNLTLHVGSPDDEALPTPFGFITRIHLAKDGLEEFVKGRQNLEVRYAPLYLTQPLPKQPYVVQ